MTRRCYKVMQSENSHLSHSTACCSVEQSNCFSLPRKIVRPVLTQRVSVSELGSSIAAPSSDISRDLSPPGRACNQPMDWVVLSKNGGRSYLGATAGECKCRAKGSNVGLCIIRIRIICTTSNRGAGGGPDLSRTGSAVGQRIRQSSGVDL